MFLYHLGAGFSGVGAAEGGFDSPVEILDYLFYILTLLSEGEREKGTDDSPDSTTLSSVDPLAAD